MFYSVIKFSDLCNFFCVMVSLSITISRRKKKEKKKKRKKKYRRCIDDASQTFLRCIEHRKIDVLRYRYTPTVHERHLYHRHLENRCSPRWIFWVFMNARSIPVHERLWPYRYLEKWVLAKVYFLGVHECPFITQFINASDLVGTWKIGYWPSCIFWGFMNAHF